MTTPTVAQVVTRGRGARETPTCIGMALAELRALHAMESGEHWPSDKYRENPIGFAHEIIGQETWEAQDEILVSVRDHDRTSVRSGHKIGKSNTAALLAFWWFCSFPDARAVFSSVTARQVDAILWREVRKMRSRAGRCVACKKADEQRTNEQRRRFPAPVPCPHSSLIDGKMADLARSGFRADDMREIVGFTAREAEAVAGISGEYILYELDEASGIEDLIFEAIEGNRAGGAKIILFSNPTRTEGEFYLSHTEKKKRTDAGGRPIGFYNCIHVSSEDTPNVRQGRKVIPGLATREWVEEKRAEWGEDSALYKVRVKGEFVLNEDGKIISVHAIESAEARWQDSCDDKGVLEVSRHDGRLHIGADPAGPGRAGDEHGFVARRGLKVVEIRAQRGLTEDQHVTEILKLLSDHKLPQDDTPVVTIDREGPIGSRIYGLLVAHLDLNPGAFILVGVRSSDRAQRQPNLYDRTRDELWANLAAWFRIGGAIPEDTRLARELHAPSWFQPLGSSKLKATSKDDIKLMLDGRSPDRADALCLALWEPRVYREPAAQGGAAAAEREDTPVERGMNPYAGTYGSGRGMDPYGGSGFGGPR